MNEAKQNDKTTDIAFYVLLFALVAGALLSVGFIIASFI